MEQTILLLTVPELKDLISNCVLDCFAKQANQSKPQAMTTALDARLLSCKEAAKQLHITTRTLSEWTFSGVVQGYRIGRRVLYKASEIEAALSAITIKKCKNDKFKNKTA